MTHEKQNDRSALAGAISEVLKPLGFKKRANSWYASRDEAIQLVNLQKSAWSGQHYINLAVWFTALGKRELPKEHECHVRMRLTSIPAVNREAVEAAMNLETADQTAESRVATVKDALVRFGVPALELVSTVGGLAGALKDDRIAYAIVHEAARRLATGEGTMS